MQGDSSVLTSRYRKYLFKKIAYNKNKIVPSLLLHLECQLSFPKLNFNFLTDMFQAIEEFLIYLTTLFNRITSKTTNDMNWKGCGTVYTVTVLTANYGQSIFM
jgi:hypothetical protein